MKKSKKEEKNERNIRKEKNAVKGLFSEKTSELTYENAKKEMERFLESEKKTKM